MEIAISFTTILFILVGIDLLLSVNSLYKNSRPTQERVTEAMERMEDLEEAFGDAAKTVHKVLIYIIGFIMIALNLAIGFILQNYLIIAAMAIIFSIFYLIRTFVLVNRVNKDTMIFSDRFPWFGLVHIFYLVAVLIIIGF
jgi:hypothetical protein